jgi:hypothetical protein
LWLRVAINTAAFALHAFSSAVALLSWLLPSGFWLLALYSPLSAAIVIRSSIHKLQPNNSTLSPRSKKTLIFYITYYSAK